MWLILCFQNMSRTGIKWAFRGSGFEHRGEASDVQTLSLGADHSKPLLTTTTKPASPSLQKPPFRTRTSFALEQFKSSRGAAALLGSRRFSTALPNSSGGSRLPRGCAAVPGGCRGDPTGCPGALGPARPQLLPCRALAASHREQAP